MRITPALLIEKLGKIVDPVLAKLAIDSYVDMQQRFAVGDWGPAELDAGRLCEAVSRCLLQLDTGIINYTHSPGDVRKVVLDDNHSHLVGQKDRAHISKLIDVVYKFRSDRGAVHISPTYTANGIDAMFVLHAAKWILGELVRLALKQDHKTVEEIISQLAQLEHSLIHDLDGRPLVLAKGISAPEEVLLLLFNTPGNRLARGQLLQYASNQRPQTVRTAISRLITQKDIRVASDGEVALTPNGQKRVIEEVLPKWSQVL